MGRHFPKSISYLISDYIFVDISRLRVYDKLGRVYFRKAERKTMKIDEIYACSSENMPQTDDKSISLIVTSPPYNIDIQYGNKTSKGKVVESKGVKYSDNMDDFKDMYLKNLTIWNLDWAVQQINVLHRDTNLYFGMLRIRIITHLT